MRRADLEARLLERDKKTVRADFDGVVIEKGAEVGEWLAVGGLVARVADDRNVEGEIPLPQQFLEHVANGAEVEVTVNGRPMKGVIRAAIPLADKNSRTVPVRVRLSSDQGLAAGTEAMVTLPVGEAVRAMIVLRDALVDKGMGPMVVAVQDGAARMVPVRPLVYAGNRVGIESEGLQDGDRVVVKGNERLQPGQPLAVIDTGQ
ncbi:MAG: efflux RND transporter periplasmic adaptor subunit [Deltaproteobacteria bacterium]|nr:efflux RND transporter periplasmic adaptor subunit [Deltaproteobacteria bacterium]